MSHIRTATLKDAEAIALIHLRSWQKMYKEFIPETILKSLSLQERTQQWHDLLKKGVKVLVSEMDNQMVGFASICPFRDIIENGPIGEISAIYLHPDYWRMGLGTQLCLAALSELVDQGYKKVCLWVLADNTQARGFYEALGFEATGSTKLEEFYDGGALLKEILYKKML
ncbi:GNAT family N-acetyltransferase [Legionella maioricensis]|uniref:GNAT family N-acetyltransferase n=1 Tax=Legionella maioricensis TaxID=2896528 RepID=A0A9X2IBM7_9GAMM|nr:GNAT family N-acetyltransferase [Legionella maioricensis]MCL9684396.1 GNAT family N-acetyltransferase [Legionella maioricensis]MCL9687577.1 GNAT family N-acetyltransferase [Legionella maioricensis]